MIKAYCSECSTDNGHLVECNVSNARYQIILKHDIIGNSIENYAHTESALYAGLVELRELRGTLAGVKVYDYDKKLTRQQLGELALRMLNA